MRYQQPAEGAKDGDVIRALLLALIVLALAAFAALGVHEIATPDTLRSELEALRALNIQHPAWAAAAFLGAHICCAALSLPLNVPIAVAAGAVFGLPEGVLLAAPGAAIGSTLAMLSSRFILRDWVQRRYATRLAAMQVRLAGDETALLLSLRLMPAVPYTAVNLIYGLTSMSPLRFAITSLLGMLPGKFVFVHAGTQLAALHSFSDILSIRTLSVLVLLAALPWVSRRVAAFIERRRRIPI